MHSVIRPNAWVALKLPSGSTKVLQITPNTYVCLRNAFALDPWMLCVDFITTGQYRSENTAPCRPT